MLIEHINQLSFFCEMKLNDYSSKANLCINIFFYSRLVMSYRACDYSNQLNINTAFLMMHNIFPFDATITSYLHRQCPPTLPTLYCLCVLIDVC